MAASSKRKLADCKSPAVTAYHPTKGNRRVSFRRIAAQGRIPHAILTFSQLGYAVR